jgi:sulfur-oxidizing protein SoxA
VKTRRRLLFLLLCFSLPGETLAEEKRKSGYEFMSRETRAMQDDEATGPAALWLLDGEAQWRRDCAGCHSEAGMKGVAARYPALYKGKLVNLEQRINICRVEQQKAPALAYESRELLALAVYVGRQSRGLPIAVVADEKTRPHLDRGREAFFRRQGQLNLACTQCHDDNWGRKLAGSTIPQAHPSGYPIYRLEWQAIGSLQRRLRTCLTGMRAENYPFGASELVELELYLMWRARGMKLETPAVRP